MTNGSEIIATGLFDADYYVETYPDIAAAGIEPAEHYARFGQHEGRAPNAYFEPATYRATVGDIGSMSLLLHYARLGEAADLPPGPHFDPTWYRHAYRLPRSVSALADFLRNRASCRRLPARRFYASIKSRPEATLLSERDCFASIIDGLAEGRTLPTEVQVVAASGLFDANHYLINGSDVHEASLDPIDHFCTYGWQEGRQPNIYFNTGWYVRSNPDVERLGINPLVHYILEGETQGRRPVVYFDPSWYRARYRLAGERGALAHFLANRRSQQYSPNSRFDLEWYLRSYGRHVGPNRDPFAHFLQAGTYKDVCPAPDFDASAVRRKSLGRRSRHFGWLLHPNQDNPLIRSMHERYA